MNDYKIPWDELSGESNLKGTYKVTFLVNISKEDEVSIDDLRQSIASSFAGDPVLEKTAKLDLEKTDETGASLPTEPKFQVGDVVVVKEDVTISAEIERHESLYIVGAKSLSTEKLGEGTIIIPAGATARINSIDGDQVELIDFENVVSASLMNRDTGALEDLVVNVDSVIFADNCIVHCSKEDENLWL
jgi:hypothetical protein